MSQQPISYAAKDVLAGFPQPHWPDALTTGVAFIDLGPFNTVVALAIAFSKMMLVIFFFMHVRHSGGLVRSHLDRGHFSGWLC